MSNSVDSRRIFSYVFIFALALLFALEWGPGSRGCGQTGPGGTTGEEAAATVNGKEIPLKDFARAYGGQLNMMRSQGVTAELARQFGLPRQVLDNMVTAELLAQAAEQRGISASDAEVLEQLKKNPDFQKDGKFDLDRYRDILREYYKMPDVNFEADLRRRLAATKVLDLVEAAAVVSDDEVKAKYTREGNKASATFVKFSAVAFGAKVTPPKPAELDAWTKSHESEIAAYYEQNKLSYHQPERIKARQILLRATKEDGQQKRDDAKTKIENVRKEIEGGKDFAELAKAVSEDTETKEKGGDLGLVERITLPPTLANAAFALAPGQLSQPVETPLGWHLVKVEEKKPPETKSLEQVKGEIALQLWTRDQAKVLAKAEAEKALTALKSGKKLAELYPPSKDEEESPFQFNADKKPAATETGDFTTSSLSIPQLGTSPELMKDVFALEAPKALEKVYDVGDAFAVVQVDTRSKPSDAEFEQKKAELKVEAIKGKQFELRESFLKGLKSSGSIVINDRAVDQVSQG